MTENLLQKLEEKMMMLLAEVEDLRKEIQHLNHTNSSLKLELDSQKNENKKYEDELKARLESLVSLLDSVNNSAPVSHPVNVAQPTTLAPVKPILLQEQAS